MMVLLLAGGVRTKKDKQPRNFHLNVTVIYILLARRYTDAIKLTTAHCFLIKRDPSVDEDTPIK